MSSDYVSVLRSDLSYLIHVYVNNEPRSSDDRTIVDRLWDAVDLASVAANEPWTCPPCRRREHEGCMQPTGVAHVVCVCSPTHEVSS